MVGIRPENAVGMNDVLAALDDLLRRGDTAGVKALFQRLLKARKPKPRPQGEQLLFRFMRTDDATFAAVMANWDSAIARANERKRQREAEAEARRIEKAKAARTPMTAEEQIAAIIARGRTPGQMLELAQDGREWTIAKWSKRIEAPENRIYVAAHDLETKSFLRRLRPGVYVARSSEGATNERCEGRKDRKDGR